MFKTRLARENWESKYRYKDETPLQTQQRVAWNLAKVENDPEYWYPIFLNTLVKFDENNEAIGLKNTVGGRITANIGTDYKKASHLNCFINGGVKKAIIKYIRTIPGLNEEYEVTCETEDTPDSLGNIFLSILEQAETLKSEGGYGINFGFIRPRGSVIKGIGIKHPGVIHYMSIWDRVADVIVKGDNDGYEDTLTNYLENDEEKQDVENFKNLVKKSFPLKKQARKGAMMGVLPVWHPDIEEFVRAKQESGKLTKFNISVLIDKKFIDCVVNDEYYDLHFDGEVYKRIKAKELYDLIMKCTYNRNEPGVIFYDNMQDNNPISYLSDVIATNPCGEIPGSSYMTTVCLLGSINLTQYVKLDRTFDWENYKKDISIFARMLDNVNDIASVPLGSYEWALKNIRQYGMGINGLASTLLMMGIKYNSDEGLKFANEVTWLKEDVTWKTSALLAEEKGPFPCYRPEFLETNWFKKFTNISPETKDLIRKNGVRNAKTTTNPPLGNSSIYCDMISNGKDPIFALEYDRARIVDSWPKGLNINNVKEKLNKETQGNSTIWKGKFNGRRYLYEPHNRGLCEIETVRDFGYEWVLENYSEDIKKYKNGENTYIVTCNDLHVYDHVEMQSVFQRNCNQSVSGTANVPNDYKFEDFKDLYIKAFEKGLIGFTTYREGTMEAVLSQIEEENKDLKEQNREIITKDLKLPEVFINGNMHVIKKEGMKFYIHFSYHPEDENKVFPVALWIQTNAKGEIREANAAVKKLVNLLYKFDIDSDLIEKHKKKIIGDPGHQRLGKMISMCLRHNIPILNIVLSLDELEDIYVTDTIFAVKKFLSQQVPDGTEVVGVTCTSCGGNNVIFTGGCSLCQDCGWAGCG